MTPQPIWSPVALSNMVDPSTSTGAVVNGAELVVWRDSSGKAHVWEDRCPHRGMRMSFGFVRGDHLACLYHGWQYDTAGQCRHIPAHPQLDVPQTIRMQTFASAERNGIIWAGSTTEADPALLPAEIAGLVPVRSLYADCTMEKALAILAATPLPGVSDAPKIETISENYISLTAGATRLLVAIQSMGDAKLALHLMANEGAPIAALARYAQALRLALETPLAEVA
ncbi:Rieske (2Fe-2S) protein [Rhizobium sp. C4]|uniref:Rieske (2Fe-2S) protein n=1 Tax=Rhizobium sp. C4 TaxID=1349800 RepID=UPI001E30984A|nr:Rieske (2Fe-2S) protein [Rhizobium sp. C4]MCD2172450.1 Rieske (2Fe-2S) protein [Rhizobium sp. C4]